MRTRARSAVSAHLGSAWNIFIRSNEIECICQDGGDGFLRNVEVSVVVNSVIETGRHFPFPLDRQLDLSVTSGLVVLRVGSGRWDVWV